MNFNSNNKIDIQVSVQENGLLIEPNTNILLGRLIDDGKTTFESLKQYDKKVNSGEFSDGYHTFNELYYHRMILFAVICNTFPEKAWKSWKHSDGTMYDDYFIVGVTIEGVGDYSYHYHKDNWEFFKVKELPAAPEWDGHMPSDIRRLLALVKENK